MPVPISLASNSYIETPLVVDAFPATKSAVAFTAVAATVVPLSDWITNFRPGVIGIALTVPAVEAGR